MWLWSEQIDEMFTQNLGQIQCAEVPCVVFCLEMRTFKHIYLGGNCAPVPSTSSTDKAISAIAVKIPLNKGKRWHSTAD